MADAIHDGHRQRLRERFLAEGLESFKPHEILELLLFFGIQRKDTNELAHALISRYGSLAEVLDAPYEELLREKGMTAVAASLLKLAPALSRAYLLGRRNPQPALNSTSKLSAYLADYFVGETAEVVYLLCLDSSLNAISCERVAEGTVTAANVPIRTIVSNALQHNADQVVLAHNHPRGLAIPSSADILVTRTLANGLALLDIRLVDHIVVAGGESSSIRDMYPEIFG